MDGAYLHLLVNHFPIVLSVVGVGILVLALLTRRRDLWRYSALTLLLAGVAAIPAKLTGEPAEEALEDTWYITRQAIHAHEEAADWALWVMLAAGAVAAYALWRTLRRGVAASGTRVDSLEAPVWLRALLLLFGLAGAGAMARASWEAGKIVHKNPALQQAPAGYVKPERPRRGDD